MQLISRKTLLLFFLPGAVFMGAFLIYPIITMIMDSFYEIGISGDKTFIGTELQRKQSDSFPYDGAAHDSAVGCRSYLEINDEFQFRNY